MEDPKIALVERFFSGTGSTYDRAVNLYTFGCDWLWKRQILRTILDHPMRIMDLACGTGILTFRIAREFPKARVVGVELRDEYLDIAREKAEYLAVANVEFVLSRAEDVLFDETFDCITASYLAKYADLRTLTRNVRQMLRQDGVFVMHDFTYPSFRLFAWGWEGYFKLMQRAGTWTTPQWRTVFFELPALIRKTQWLNELVALLRENAFSAISVDSMTLGTSAIVTARK